MGLLGSVDARGFLLLALWACGDLDDVQVPLVPSGARAPDSISTLRSVAQAAVTMTVESSADDPGGCPVAHSVRVPPASDPIDRETGEGVRLVDAQDARVDCVVAPRSEDVFDVALRIQHPMLRRVAVNGAIGRDESRLDLEIDTPDGQLIDAECGSRIVQVLPGAAWFELADCATHDAMTYAALGCDIAASIVVENCES